MAKTNPNDLKSLWDAGFSLDAAWIEFAIFMDRFSIQALRTHPENDAEMFGDHPRFQELKNGGWLPKSWATRIKKLAITTNAGRADLLGEIYAGNLWAIGFRTLPNGSDEMTRVPRRLFYVDGSEKNNQQAGIDWGKGELVNGNEAYFDIRIARAPSADREQPSRPSAKRKSEALRNVGGRPGTRNDVATAIRGLLKTNPKFAAMPRKIAAGEVRTRLLGESKRHEEVPGFKTSSLQKIIGQELAAQVKRSKRNKPNKP